MFHLYGAPVERYDVVVVGGGIVGLATARAVLQDRPDIRLLLLEREASLATHQTGRNSGVIHSGIYYPPGSHKARMVAAGRQPLIDLCARHDVPIAFPGKVIVATHDAELAGLRSLFDRGRGHGLAVEWLGPAGLRAIEPHVAGLAAVRVPETGVVDFGAVARAIAVEVATAGGVVRTSAEVVRLDERTDGVTVVTTGGDVQAGHVVVCAGLRADQLAFGARRDADLRIAPFRGEYYHLGPRAAAFVNTLVYPVPDPRFPFLGVHFTRGIDGDVHVGPNAVLAEVTRLATYPGLHRLVRRHWRRGLGELTRSVSKRAFTHAARRLLPELARDDLLPAPAGVRAQALRRDGSLVDDFAFHLTGRVVHVINAPSPAATASLAIGAHIADVLWRGHDDDRGTR